MRKLLALLVFAAVATAAPGGEEEPAAPEAVTLTRNLAAFPPGSYVMVQAFDEKVRYTLEAPRQEMQEKEKRTKSRFTFDLQIVASTEGETTRKEARVVVRRVQMDIEGEKDYAYDSNGKPEDQSEGLMKQFRYLVGAKATLDLSSFGEGGGFEGLNAVWDLFGKENPTFSKAAASNRRNFGDTRLDRMFARGLPLLFGPDAGRAAGRNRKLKAGETYRVGLEILGIGRETAVSEHSVTVETVEDGHVTLKVSWAENGHNPKTDGGVVLSRGGDIKGDSNLTFHLASGLLVGLRETEKRTDQTCGMDMVQRTRYATTVSEFSITPKAEPR